MRSVCPTEWMLSIFTDVLLGIVADDADKTISFHSTGPYGHGGHMASSLSSLVETGSYIVHVDPFDFSPYMDQVCLLPCSKIW